MPHKPEILSNFYEMRYPMKDLLIVGGGAAGLTAAIYAVRAGVDALVLEAAQWGGQIAQTAEVENYPSVPHIPGWELANALHAQTEALGAEIRIAAVSRLAAENGRFLLETTGGALHARSVILANGVARRKLGCPGETEFAGRGVSWCATCDGAFFRGKDVAVIGGGNAALEEALHLSQLCRSVTIVNRSEKLRAHQTLQKRAAQRETIRILAPWLTEEIVGDTQVRAVRLRHRESGAEQTLPVDGVFIAIGMEPQNAFCGGLIATDAQGYFAAGEDCRTNVPGAFVAGDCRAKPLRQLVTAMADGAVAATAATEFLSKSEPVFRK